ncbi:glycosyltransferase family 4 protein [Thiohalorhabdus sp.]|uniref:glycosyltransferase family 4 protein n=1 Tax=Thiohalorhabdus sp. TaxID=3094134 RepID=UPI002FC36A4D
MRIVYHHRTRGEDAQGIHIQALVAAFRALGHRVTLVGPRRPRAAGGGEAGAQTSGFRLLGRPVPGWVYELLALGYNVPAFLRLCAALVRERPAMVYERYALFGVAGRLAAGLFRVPFVLEVNAPLSLEMERESGLAFRGPAQALEDWLFRRATRTIVVSGAMADILEGQGTPRERLVIMPNGVDREAFHPDVDGSGVRRDLGWQDGLLVGFVGWVRPWHGVDGLVEAARRLRDAIPELRLLIVGDGPAVPALRQQAEEAGLSERVHITGAVARSEVPAHLAAMDVAVQPDVTEYASPIKLFEYLAMARPVVAPRKPNITEVVSDGEQALLFRPGSTDELTKTLQRLHADPDLRSRLGRAGARLIEERGYYWEANAQKVTELVNPKTAS